MSAKGKGKMRVRNLLVVSFTALSTACGEGPLDTQEPAGLAAAGPTQIIADAGSYVDTAILVRVIDSQNRGITGAVVHFRVTSAADPSTIQLS